jgi:hypothetical protein
MPIGETVGWWIYVDCESVTGGIAEMWGMLLEVSHADLQSCPLDLSCNKLVWKVVAVWLEALGFCCQVIMAQFALVLCSEELPL